MDQSRKTEGPALAFLTAGAAFFLLGTLFGLAAAIHLVAPDFFANIPWLVFGRIRPSHVNTVAYGFVATTLIGAALHYVPALLKTTLWSPRLGWVSFLLWTTAITCGPITFAFGITQGREYAEYVWPLDVLILAALATLIFNFVMTVARRRENVLYVSVWYALGALVWTAMVYPLGNVMWHPATGALPGITDSIFLWFFGHNLIGLLLTPLAIGAAYYVFPRVCRTPLYSHVLSLIGFWALVAMYTHIGGHHLIQAPIPNWLKTIAVVDSVAMIVPVLVVLVNLWLTARGHLGDLWRSPGGRWVLLGTIWYLFVCFQGAFQSLPSVQRVTHFNNWVVGHAHAAVLGFSGFIAVGVLWHVLPDAAGKKLHSTFLVRFQFALVAWGLFLMVAALTIAGLVQGEGWHNGETVYRILPEIKPYMVLRLAAGVAIVAGAAVGLYGVVRTITGPRPSARRQAEETLETST